MKKNLLIFEFCLTFFLGSLMGCLNSTQDLYENYNSNFSYSESSLLALNPGDTGFDEHTMLYDTYYVPTDDTLTISAPTKCHSHHWIVANPEDKSETDIEIVYSTGSSNKAKEFIVYIPESGLKVGTYRLILIVTDAGGVEYRDESNLVIYQHYEFTNDYLK